MQLNEFWYCRRFCPLRRIGRAEAYFFLPPPGTARRKLLCLLWRVCEGQRVRAATLSGHSRDRCRRLQPVDQHGRGGHARWTKGPSARPHRSQKSRNIAVESSRTPATERLQTPAAAWRRCAVRSKFSTAWRSEMQTCRRKTPACAAFPSSARSAAATLLSRLRRREPRSICR
jgi:hypothetical protein